MTNVNCQYDDASKPCPCGAGPHEAHRPARSLGDVLAEVLAKSNAETRAKNDLECSIREDLVELEKLIHEARINLNQGLTSTASLRLSQMRHKALLTTNQLDDLSALKRK
jgi:hypothetical protein